jgi:alkanesulfonate monooxygenase SsuD/methylene tetrahydromethanopterin reductase-like flavin-dependent oxidoreductase (luciferase family)
MEVRGRPLHFGIQLRGQATTWSEYVAALQGVEELGYGSVWMFDHLLPYSGADDRPCFETLTTLGAMAALTTNIRIGVLVNGVIYRDPAVLAKAAAQVDEMSDGRLEFALGAAWAVREFTAYGIEFPPLAERYARLDEALELIKLLWSQHRTTFQGRYYHLEAAPCEPKPVQAPYPPVTVGGSGTGTLRIAARHANRLNFSGPPEKFSEKAGKLRQFCDEIGRDFDDIELSAHPSLAVGRTREEAEAMARRTASIEGIDLEDERSSWVLGDPAEAVRQLRRYLDVGVSHFVFGAGYPFDLGPLQLMQEEVFPALS